LSQSSSQASEQLSRAVSTYNRGQFSQAIRQLKLAEASDPKNASIHYYLANALVHSGQHASAIQHYDRCYRLSPWSSSGYYSLQALIAYRHYHPELYRRLADHQAAQLQSTHESLQRLRNTTAGALQSTYSANIALSETKDLISRQAGFEKHRSDGEAKQGADFALAHGLLSAESIKRQAEEHADYAKNHPPISGYTRWGQPIYDYAAAEAEAARIRQDGQARAESAQQTAKRRAEGLTAWATHRAGVLDEVVSNLHGQLEAPVGRSGVKLNPVGTDLYVRFYGNGNNGPPTGRSGRPSNLALVPPPQGLRARAESLDSPATAASTDSPDSWKSVRGKIIGPVRPQLK
jgi:hypothetical protein